MCGGGRDRGNEKILKFERPFLTVTIVNNLFPPRLLVLTIQILFSGEVKLIDWYPVDDCRCAMLNQLYFLAERPEIKGRQSCLVKLILLAKPWLFLAQTQNAVKVFKVRLSGLQPIVSNENFG